MTDAERGQVATEAAEVYESFFVPALFAQWPARVLDAAAVGHGDSVLDVGCGTGVLAREAARRVGPSGSVAGLDINDGMLAVARRSAEDVRWETGAAGDMPFPDGSFDRVVSQFVMMFVEDRGAFVEEIARVVRPGGSVAVATWASLDDTPGYAAMVGLLEELFGEEAADALRAPYVLGDPSDVAGALSTGFPDVTVDQHRGVARFASIEAWVHTDIRGWTLASMIDDNGYQRLLAAAEERLAGFKTPDGSVEFAAPAIIASAQAPD